MKDFDAKLILVSLVLQDVLEDPRFDGVTVLYLYIYSVDKF